MIEPTFPVLSGARTMAVECSFVVPGEPVPKARARVSLRRAKDGSTKVRAHTPKKTVAYETRVGLYANSARPRGWPTGCAYKVSFAAYVGADRADIDNLLKSLLDGAQGILWSNDKGVRRLGECEVVTGDPTPRMEVRITALPVRCKLKGCGGQETFFPDEQGRCETCAAKRAR